QCLAIQGSLSEAHRQWEAMNLRAKSERRIANSVSPCDTLPPDALPMANTEQLGLAFQAPSRKIYPVRELVAAVRTQVERAFTDIYVEGEISNYRPADSGHLYFTLKDGTAQLRVVMWRTQARLLRFRPENGLQI